MKKTLELCERCENEREVRSLNDQLVCYDCWLDMGEEAFFAQPYKDIDDIVEEFDHDEKS